MLPKKRRINRVLFKSVLKEGKNFHSNFFTVKVSKNPNEDSKFSFVVSVKVEKRSVGRNILKRRGKAVILKNIKEIKESLIVIVFVKKEAKKLSYKDFEKNLVLLFKKARII